MRLPVIVLNLGLAAVAGCQNGRAGGEVPARITDPTPESRSELSAIVSQALNTDDLVIASDALTADSRLLIERQAHASLEHGRVLGRDLGAPEEFRLIKQGERCILIHAGTGKRWKLMHTRCAAE